MKKALPPSTVAGLRPPNVNYTYFEDWRSNPFRHDAAVFELVNAWWLADLSLLTYAEEDFVNRTFAETGLKDAGFSVKCFGGGAVGAQFLVVHDERFIVVSFRGSDMSNFWQELLDVVTIFKFLPAPDESGGHVYGGFKAALDSVWDELRRHLREIEGEGAGRRKLWFTGHSMGAGLTTLAAAKAAREGVQVQGVYTFGSPRVGDKGFGDYMARAGLAEITYRFVNHDDIVTRSPPPGFYEHVGVLEYLDGDGRLRSLESAADITGFKFRLFNLAARILRYLSRLVGERQFIFPRFQADHAPICYSINIWNNYDGTV